MNDQKYDNRGAIWPNDRKEKETQPDFKGKGNLRPTCPNCNFSFLIHLWLSGWRKAENASPNAPACNLSFEVAEDPKPHTDQMRSNMEQGKQGGYNQANPQASQSGYPNKWKDGMNKPNTFSLKPNDDEIPF